MRPLETASGLAAVLRGVVADMQHASGADIVSIFLYEESSRTYYAPFANGQPQESLLDSLADMREQLARYMTDLSQGKVPDDFAVHHYGSTVWLTITRQKLVARDAASEIDSTFMRRYQVQATIGLPLLAGDRLLGLVYLNYRQRDHAPDSVRLEERWSIGRATPRSSTSCGPQPRRRSAGARNTATGTATAASSIRGGALETKAGRTRTIPSATSTGRPPKRLRIAPVETPLWRRLEVTGLRFAGHRIDFSVDGTRVKLEKLPPGIIVDTHRR